MWRTSASLQENTGQGVATTRKGRVVHSLSKMGAVFVVRTVCVQLSEGLCDSIEFTSGNESTGSSTCGAHFKLQ